MNETKSGLGGVGYNLDLGKPVSLSSEVKWCRETVVDAGSKNTHGWRVPTTLTTMQDYRIQETHTHTYYIYIYMSCVSTLLVGLGFATRQRMP